MNMISEEVLALEPDIIAWRRHMHQNPELSFQEVHTTAYLTEELKKIPGLTLEFPTKTGVVAVLKGVQPGPVLALRADIDALPIQEETGLPYASTVPGVMHACGHDNHMAMLLGAAKILNEVKDELSGDVRLVFQPAEETAVGALRMMEEHALDGVDAIFGQHVWGTLDIPYIDVTAGPRMAYSGRFTVDVIGTSSHAATPHLGADAITGAAAIINNLQQYVSRMSNPLDPVVLTIGTISGGNRYNAIANHVTMEGVTRAYFLDKHEEAMRQIVENTAEGLGMKAVLKYAHVVHPVINDDDDLTEIAQKAVVKLFGEETLCHMPAMMGSEDFANYAAEIPAVFGFIGCRDEANGMIYNNHHEKFTVNESLLPKGTALMAQFAVDYLAGNA